MISLLIQPFFGGLADKKEIFIVIVKAIAVFLSNLMDMYRTNMHIGTIWIKLSS